MGIETNVGTDIRNITIYTGSNGKNGCLCNCPGCSLDRYSKNNENYQGTIEQVKYVLNKFPNVERAIILGNPDPNIDPEFCNEVAKLLISKNIKVRFSTSGYNAEDTVKTLLKDLDYNFVEYVSFSIDSIDERKLAKLKGKKFNFDEIDKAIEYCHKNNFIVKIQPTLWEENQDDYKDIINYFGERKVNWFSFHAGSFESFDNEVKGYKHIEPLKWRYILKDIASICEKNKYKLHMPYLFLYEDEFNKYIKVNGTKCKIENLKNAQIWLEKDFIRTTHCPLLNEITNFDYNLYDSDKSNLNINGSKSGYCPVTTYSLDSNIINKSENNLGYIFRNPMGEKLYSICRFYNLKIN